MDHERVWTMPVKRFWSMERNISRVMAEQDIRKVQVSQAPNSSENNEAVLGRLTRELGDTYRLTYPKVVKPEVGAKEKFRHVTR